LLSSFLIIFGCGSTGDWVSVAGPETQRIRLGEGWQRRVRTARKPNVLLILCDDLNDYIGVLDGHSQAQTPHLDRLAESAVTFTNAHSNCPVCAPSRNSFFTGIYTHRSRDFGWQAHDEIPLLSNTKTLMEYFQENGYRLLGTGKLLHHARKDLYDEWGVDINNYGPFAFGGEEPVGHPSVPEPFRSIGPIDGSFAPLSDVPAFPNGGGEDGWVYSWDGVKRFVYLDEENRDLMPDELHAQWAADKIQELDAENLQKPFFMAVGFVRPHTPLHAPGKFFDNYPVDELQLAPLLQNDEDDTYYREVYPSDRKGLRYYRALEESYPEIKTGLKHFLQAYLASVSFVDEQIGTVLRALEESRFRNDTVVVLTSDHGWNMGEKEYLFKNSPWEESTRVPLIIRAPAVFSYSSQVDHPVSLIDVYPTLVDLCNLQGDTRKNAEGGKLDGYSLRPFLRDPWFDGWEGPEGVLSVLGVGEDRENVLEQNYSYRTQFWRYTLYRNGREELYDHRTDPHEWTNLASDEAYLAKKQELRSEMMAIVEQK
jgi:arylsulfatase A-like enzyme